MPRSPTPTPALLIQPSPTLWILWTSGRRVEADQTGSEDGCSLLPGPREGGRRGREGGGVGYGDGGASGSTLPAVVCHTEPRDSLVLISDVLAPCAFLLLILLLSA